MLPKLVLLNHAENISIYYIKSKHMMYFLSKPKIQGVNILFSRNLMYVESLEMSKYIIENPIKRMIFKLQHPQIEIGPVVDAPSAEEEQHGGGRLQRGGHRKPGEPDLDEKFGKFDIKSSRTLRSAPNVAGHPTGQVIEQGDETISMVSDTWSTGNISVSVINLVLRKLSVVYLNTVLAPDITN